MGPIERYAAAWRHVAARFRRADGVLGYDLINEPMPGTAPLSCASPDGCAPFEHDRLAPFYQQVTAAIRSVDRRTPISYEPTAIFGSGGGTALPRLRDHHAVFGWHLYCPGGPCPQIEEGQFARAAAHTGGAEPQLLSEFGSTRDTSVLDRVQAEADHHLVGWMEWTYFSNGITDNSGTPSLVLDPRRPPRGDNLDGAQAKALTRPHASAIAGIPLSTAYDPDRARAARGVADAPRCHRADADPRARGRVPPRAPRGGARRAGRPRPRLRRPRARAPAPDGAGHRAAGRGLKTSIVPTHRWAGRTFASGDRAQRDPALDDAGEPLGHDGLAEQRHQLGAAQQVDVLPGALRAEAPVGAAHRRAGSQCANGSSAWGSIGNEYAGVWTYRPRATRGSSAANAARRAGGTCSTTLEE